MREPSPHEAAAITATGYDASRLNALQHGVLSRFAVLPWEDEREHQDLIDALTAEHAPAGPTETHLVVELAGVLWRKRRLRLAEAAAYQRGLSKAANSHSGTASAALVLADSKTRDVNVAEAVRCGARDPADDLASLDEDRNKTQSAIEILESGRNLAYEDALAMLQDDTRTAWEDQLTWETSDYGPDKTPYTADAASLESFLKVEILPWYNQMRVEIEGRPAVRLQALGESLDPNKLERLGRYETHLDRKFERTLSTLLRLQELRRGRGGVPDGAG